MFYLNCDKSSVGHLMREMVPKNETVKKQGYGCQEGRGCSPCLS